MLLGREIYRGQAGPDKRRVVGAGGVFGYVELAEPFVFAVQPNLREEFSLPLLPAHANVFAAGLAGLVLDEVLAVHPLGGPAQVAGVVVQWVIV